jgi:Chitobiase/beta-hexosaminidase C-terminal domain/Fibronectin type III domain
MRRERTSGPGPRPAAGRGPRRPPGRGALAGGLAAALAAAVVGLAPAASAAVPQAPDNIVVYPDRDAVSLEGFVAASGQDISVEVHRGATVVGSATVSGAPRSAIAAGSATAVVNSPGGVCWGAGGGLQVTPDIRAGDVVTVAFGGTTAATTVQDVEVTGSAVNGDRLTVTWRTGPTVDPGRIEQRIVNPALRDDPDIARRSVRAIPPAVPVAAPSGKYLSGLALAGGGFTATYDFRAPSTAGLAAAGRLRIMAWQAEDPDGHRQGLTIGEFGQADGPSMNGCPSGAGEQLPTGVTATQDGPDILVRWTPPQPDTGTPPVLGYTVRAVATSGGDGAHQEFGLRITDPAASSARLPGTLAGHRIEVRTLTRNGESWPPALDNTPVAGPVPDTTPPSAAASPSGGGFTGPVQVSLTSPDPSAQIYYTLDGSNPLDAPDSVAADAITYTRPFTVAGRVQSMVTLRYVTIDAADNTSPVEEEVYTFGVPTAPGAPVLGPVTPGDGRVTVAWAPPASTGSSPVIGYTVTARPSGGAAVTAVAGRDATSAVVPGLVNGATYAVSVTATNSADTGAPSAAVTVTPSSPAQDTLTVTRAHWAPGDLVLEGTGTRPGATVTVHAGGSSGAVVGTAFVAPPPADADAGTWVVRVRTGPFATDRPTDVHVVSSGGADLGPVPMTDG